MKLTTLKVVPVKPSIARGKHAASQSKYYSPLAKGHESPAARTSQNDDHRRSQRVLLRVPAHVHVALQGKTESFDVTTLSVNHQGALMMMDRSLPLDTRLVLENARTRERVACKVVRNARETADGFQVPVEFDSPAPTFWGIAFPPADWRPEDS